MASPFRVNERGFTLVELVMVMLLIGILSAAGSSLFLKRETFSTFLARDQLLVIAAQAQKKAMAVASSSQPVFLNIHQTNSAWLMSLSFQGSTLVEYSTERSGSQLALNNNVLSDGNSFQIAYNASGETGDNQHFRLTGSHTHHACISSTGFPYEGQCVP